MKQSITIIGMAAFGAFGTLRTAHGQTTWYVDDINCNQGPGTGTPGDPFCTIQAGINAASSGDEVVLADGDYDEAINMLGKAITLRSTDPTDPVVVAATIIDGFHLGTSVITCNSGEGAGTVINGLTITRGNPTLGGGMSNINASPTVMNCTFSSNKATGGGAKGGGMYNDNASPDVIDCTFSNNASDYIGAGMYNTNGSNPDVTDCMFDNNIAGPSGGGMYNTASSPIIVGCTFDTNHATGGGAIENVQGSNATITDCTFIANSATTGGAIDINYSEATITNCSFSDNTATGGGGVHSYESTIAVTNCRFTGGVVTSGGGMSLNYTEATVANCSFSGNASTSGGAMHVHDSTVTIDNCVMWGDSGSYPGVYEIMSVSSTTTISFTNIWGGMPAGAIDGGGNVDTDPLFVDEVGGDLRLEAGSPCIDAGNNAAVPAGVTTDLDGNARFVDDPNTPDTGSGPAPIVDMGAYEVQSEGCYADCDQSTGAGVLDIFDFLCFQNSFVNGDPYACDCDTSTGPGVCDIFDFLCFQNAFVAGCP